MSSVRKKSSSFGVNAGTSSLLLVFVILCLVSFAALSLVSANANKRLNEEVLQNDAAYYNACNTANEKIAYIDASLKVLYDSGISREEYFEESGEETSFAIPVTDVQTLSITLAIHYPEADGDTFVSVEKWKLETTGTLSTSEDSDKLNLLF